MAVVGGLGTIEGALVGAAVVTAVVQLLNYVATLAGMPGYAPSVLSYAAFSMLLISSVLFLPDGLTASRPLRALVGRWRARAMDTR
jgi:branched-chain amino acid transport system permease protein